MLFALRASVSGAGGVRRVPTLDRETALWRRGFTAVAGVDEAGRGPLAGPVTAGVVIIPPGFSAPWLSEVRDSKLLSAARRSALAAAIRAALPGAAVGTVEAAEIDDLGIGPAVRLAMLRAVLALPHAPDYLLVDGRERVAVGAPQEAVVDGDALCVSIAAASILAKEYRDAIMERLDIEYPEWGFAKHKGYPTADHRRLLATLGPSAIHRRSYAPVARAAAAPRAALP